MEASVRMEIEEPVATTTKQSAHDLLEVSRTAMEELAAKILFIKREGKPKSELGELISQISLLFVTLRQVNRLILLEEDSVKADTESAKVPVDVTILQLHNLMYEKNHYLKAIKACMDFRSKHPDIELVSEEEFFRKAPEDIKSKLLSSDEAHDLMLKRLNFELFQRKELWKHHEKLERLRKGLVDTISSQKKFLSSLPSMLKSLKKASLPVQHQLGILHSKKIKQHRFAELLPLPLYILYSQLLAQKDAFGEKIDMEILGNMKEAQAFAEQEANSENSLLTNLENTKLDDDIPDEEDDGQRRRKRSKNTTKNVTHQSGAHQSHPLKIVLHIYDDDVLKSKLAKLLTLTFEYLVKLNVVGVGTQDVEEEVNGYLLCNLFPEDTGMELPHQEARILGRESVSSAGGKVLRPYKWAQHLAGMDILPESPPLCGGPGEATKGSEISSGLSLYRRQRRVQTILDRIRLRKKAQMALAQQLDSLMKLKWPLLEYENVPWASWKPLCTLHQCLNAGNQKTCVLGLRSEQIAAGSVGFDIARSSQAILEETENAREDGELPLVLQVATISANPDSGSMDFENSTFLDSMSKNVKTFKKARAQTPRRYGGDDLELILDSESDLEEQPLADQETGDVNVKPEAPWEDEGARLFHLVLSRIDSREQTFKLEAKLKISVEYPVRPPVFSLNMQTEKPLGIFRWHNALRAMEDEVNVHIIRIIPPGHEFSILAHQVHCLAMLFDLQFAHPEAKRTMTVVGTSSCVPVHGLMTIRSFRGRNRRKMLPWMVDESR